MQVDEEECRKTKPVSSVKCSRNDCDTWEVNLLLAQDSPFLGKNGKMTCAFLRNYKNEQLNILPFCPCLFDGF